MGAPSSRNGLHFAYSKSYLDIQEASKKKVILLGAKITEREARIARLRKEFEITDQDMIQLLSQAAQDALSNMRSTATMSYSIGGGASGGEVRIVGAGIVQNILTERQLIEQEKDDVERLQLIVRNLRPLTRYSATTGEAYQIEYFDLSEADLTFLGF